MKIQTAPIFNNILQSQNFKQQNKLSYNIKACPSDTFTASKNSRVNFKAHPDFNRLKEHYPITASSYFRRGPMYGSPTEEFSDIIYAFNEIFSNKQQLPKSVLIAGIGDSQEPFSYLATIKDMFKNKYLKKVVDLNIVDLQSKPSHKKLVESSYWDFAGTPWFAQDGFIVEKNHKSSFWNRYKVNDEIFNYLENTYNNPKKSKWETPIQQAIIDYPNESFDIISINNTLGYIEDLGIIKEVQRNVYRILKPNGIFITDPHRAKPEFHENYIEIKPGIYQKIA